MAHSVFRLFLRSFLDISLAIRDSRCIPDSPNKKLHSLTVELECVHVMYVKKEAGFFSFRKRLIHTNHLASEAWFCLLPRCNPLVIPGSSSATRLKPNSRKPGGFDDSPTREHSQVPISIYSNPCPQRL